MGDAPHLEFLVNSKPWEHFCVGCWFVESSLSSWFVGLGVVGNMAWRANAKVHVELLEHGMD